MMKAIYYHVTFSCHIGSIQSQGIQPDDAPIALNRAGSKRYSTKAEIHAFTHYLDAVRWAAEIESEFRTSMDSGAAAIVEFNPEHEWKKNTISDSLRRPTLRGAWVTSRKPVWPERIRFIHVLTREMVKEVVPPEARQMDMCNSMY
jgi:hypothetical protein